MPQRAQTATVLRLGGWAAYANGVVAAVGLAFLLALYASFAVGATSIGLVFGWINDVSAVVAALLMLPLVVSPRPTSATRSGPPGWAATSSAWRGSPSRARAPEQSDICTLARAEDDGTPD